MSYSCIAMLTAVAYFLIFMHKLPLGYYISPALTFESGEWRSVIQFSSNAYFPWRIDRLLLALTKPFATSEDLHAVFAASFIVFACGFALLLSWIKTELGVAEIAICTLILSIILALRFNEDIVIFQSIAWLPWLVVSAGNAFSNQRSVTARIIGMVVVVFLADSLAHGANQLSAICAIIAGIFGAIIAQQGNRLEGAPACPSPLTLITFLALIVPCAVALWQTPSPTWIDYPPLAHVVPDDDIPGIIQPLFGPEAPIQSVDRIALTKLFGKVTIYMQPIWLLAILIPNLRPKRNWPRTARLILVGTTLIIAALTWDTLLPETIAQIGPIASLSRMMPHVIFVSLTPLFAALALSGLSLSLTTGRYPILGSALLLLAILPVRHSSIPAQAPVITSPSLALLKDQGLWILDRRHIIEHTSFSAPPRDITILTLSGLTDPALNNLVDNNEGTRWSVGGGNQRYGQGFVLKFSTPISLSGIELSTGNFSSDFPEGVAISSCDSNNQKLDTLAQYSSWQGPIMFTPSGYPYYGGQNDVRIIFERSATVSCLMVKQIGTRASFDWSVSELRIAKDLS